MIRDDDSWDRRPDVERSRTDADGSASRDQGSAVDDQLDPELARWFARGTDEELPVEVAAGHLWQLYRRARPSAVDGLAAAPRERRLRRSFAGATVVLLAFVLPGLLAHASAEALPGDPLYGVKRHHEQAQLASALTWTSRDELLADQAEQRLAEAQAVAGSRPLRLAGLIGDAAAVLDLLDRSPVSASRDAVGRLRADAARRLAALVKGAYFDDAEQRAGVAVALARLGGPQPAPIGGRAIVRSGSGPQGSGSWEPRPAATPSGSVGARGGPANSERDDATGNVAATDRSPLADRPASAAPRTPGAKGTAPVACAPTTAPTTVPTTAPTTATTASPSAGPGTPAVTPTAPPTAADTGTAGPGTPAVTPTATPTAAPTAPDSGTAGASQTEASALPGAVATPGTAASGGGTCGGGPPSAPSSEGGTSGPGDDTPSTPAPDATATVPAPATPEPAPAAPVPAPSPASTPPTVPNPAVTPTPTDGPTPAATGPARSSTPPSRLRVDASPPAGGSTAPAATEAVKDAPVRPTTNSTTARRTTAPSGPPVPSGSLGPVETPGPEPAGRNDVMGAATAVTNLERAAGAGAR